ncbi:hypothetical protein PMAYCL1PPCAC_13533, partial [Pristionchus mayeri]
VVSPVVVSPSVVGRVSSVVPVAVHRDCSPVSSVGVSATETTVVAATVALLRDDDHFEEGEPRAS